MSFVVRNDRMFSAHLFVAVVVIVKRTGSPFLFAYMGDDDDDVGEHLTTMHSIIHLEEQKRAFLCEHGRSSAHKVETSIKCYLCLFLSPFYINFFPPTLSRFSIFCVRRHKNSLLSDWRACARVRLHALPICNAERSYFIIIICSESNWIINAFYKTGESIKATHLAAFPLHLPSTAPDLSRRCIESSFSLWMPSNVNEFLMHKLCARYVHLFISICQNSQFRNLSLLPGHRIPTSIPHMNANSRTNCKCMRTFGSSN